MTTPTSFSLAVCVRTDTPVTAEELPSGQSCLKVGEWPAVLHFLGSRADLRGLLHRALGELTPPSSLDEFISDCVSDCVEGT